MNERSGFKIFDKGVLDLLDFVTSNIMLPVGGMLIAVFAGWVMSRTVSAEEFSLTDQLAFSTWRLLVRYVVPLGVAIVSANADGLI